MSLGVPRHPFIVNNPRDIVKRAIAKKERNDRIMRPGPRKRENGEGVHRRRGEPRSGEVNEGEGGETTGRWCREVRC